MRAPTAEALLKYARTTTQFSHQHIKITSYLKQRVPRLTVIASAASSARRAHTDATVSS
jgi:hypothetical protein